MKRPVKPTNVRKPSVPTNVRPYDNVRSRPVASKLAMRKTANGVMKYSIPKAKSGSAYRKKETVNSRKTVGKKNIKMPLKPSAIPRINPLRKRQVSVKNNFITIYNPKLNTL